MEASLTRFAFPLLAALCVVGVLDRALVAQTPGDPQVKVPAEHVVDEAIDDGRLLQEIERRCEELRAAGSMRTIAELREGADGKRVAFEPPAAAGVALQLPALRERLLRSVCVVGQYFRCTECDGWHASASSGFAVTADGLVATCFHVLEEDPVELAEGREELPSPYLFVADWRGRVFPVTEVAAADASHDVAVLRCGATGLEPLPLRTGARTGERVACLSNPDHWFAVFTEGIVARRYVVRGPAPGSESEAETAHAAAPPGPGSTYLQVTCDFAGGSSGAPVVDLAGNVLGLAQSTSTLSSFAPGSDYGEVQMVARTAVPVEALLRLRAK